MPVCNLDTDVPPVGTKVYLDTSAVMALALIPAKAAGQPVEAREETRGQRVQAFLAKLVPAKATCRSTVLAMEELAAVVRNKARQAEASRAGFASWREYKLRDPGGAVASDNTAHGQMMKMMEWAAVSLGNIGARFERCSVAAADVIPAAEQLRRAHRQLLRTHLALDAMDALHIVVAAELGATTFVSFDSAWTTVGTITVYQ